MGVGGVLSPEIITSARKLHNNEDLHKTHMMMKVKRQLQLPLQIIQGLAAMCRLSSG